MTATKTRNIVSVLKISLYHTTLAADRAHGLASWNAQAGKDGTAAEFRRAAAESEAAAEIIRAAIRAATGE